MESLGWLLYLVVVVIIIIVVVDDLFDGHGFGGHWRYAVCVAADVDGHVCQVTTTVTKITITKTDLLETFSSMAYMTCTFIIVA